MKKEISARVYRFNDDWAFDIRTRSKAFRCVEIGFSTRKEATAALRKRRIDAARVVEGAK